MIRPRYQLRLRPERHDDPVENRVASLIAMARVRFGFNFNGIILELEPMEGDVPPAMRLRQLLKVAGRRDHLRCVEATDGPESLADRPEPRRKASKRASVPATANGKAVA